MRNKTTKQEIEKWVVLQEIEDNTGIEVVYSNGENELLLDECKNKIYDLVTNNFISAYINKKLNNVFIDKIYLTLRNYGQVVLEII